MRAQPEAAGLPIGYFGASTGAAAALWAAARPEPTSLRSCRAADGQILLRGDSQTVTAPTLLIVGSRDENVLALNRRAQARMDCETALTIVPGATHLFEEPGTLAAAAEVARDWFARHFAPDARAVA